MVQNLKIVKPGVVSHNFVNLFPRIMRIVTISKNITQHPDSLESKNKLLIKSCILETVLSLLVQNE